MAQTLAIITRKFGDRGGKPAKTPACLNGRRFSDGSLILIDVHTEERIVGGSYLEPYLADAVNYIVPVIHQLAAARQMNATGSE
jgi:mandelate racemase